MSMNTIGAIAVLLLCVGGYIIKKRNDEKDKK